jgi:hypothetical protein
MPNMAHMKRIEQRVPSVQGDIDFVISRTLENLTLELTSPVNTVAMVGVPKEYFDISKISVNGKVVWQNGQARNNVSGVKFVSETSKYINFEVDPGTWEINAT